MLSVLYIIFLISGANFSKAFLIYLLYLFSNHSFAKLELVAIVIASFVLSIIALFLNQVTKLALEMFNSISAKISFHNCFNSSFCIKVT